MAASISLEQIAKLLDLTPRRVQQLSSEGIIPKSDRGRYELVPAVRGYVRYLRERALGQDLGGEQMAANKAKLTGTRAQIEEMKRARMAGEMVPREQIARAWAEVCMAVRSHLLGIPARLAARIGMAKNAVEVQQILRREIEEALSELAKVNVEIEAAPIAEAAADESSDFVGDNDIDVSDDGPAAEPHDQRVGGSETLSIPGGIGRARSLGYGAS
jgi:phage terminase Nu1 subunit (DNA packaging protein)